MGGRGRAVQRRGRVKIGAIGVAVVAMAACGGGGGGASAKSSSAGPVTTAVVTNAQFPFDATSAKEFPGTTLDQRLQMAQSVCDSIHAHGDNFPAWLALTTQQPAASLVPFAATQSTLVAFAGLAVRYVCPQYLSQLQGALNSLSASSTVSVGSSSAN